MNLLVQILRNEDALPQKCILPSELVVRGSNAPPQRDR